jgi:hypothetical protein
MMREATVKGPAIDLSEFERRLRGPQPSTTRGPDPLKELARLLQSNEAAAPADPYRDVFAEQPPKQSPRVQRRAEPAPARVELPPEHYYAEDDGYGDLRGSYDAAAPSGSHATTAHGQHQGWEQDYREPAYQEEPGYHDRAAYQNHAPQQHEGYDPHYQGHVPQDPNAGWEYDESNAYLDYGGQEESPYAEEPRRRSARSLPKFRAWHAVAGICVLGVASIGWSFAHRAGGSIAPKEIATIAAPGGPAKVPPATSEAAQPEQGATVLDRSSENATVRKVVKSEEQPVDPTVAPRALRAASDPAASADAPRQQGDPMVSVPEPRKVKTVSVRPDGSLIANDSVPPAVVAKPPKAVPVAPLDAAEADVQGGTPRIADKPATTPRAAKPTAKPAKVAVAEPPPPPADVAPPQEAEDAGQAATTGSVGSGGKSFAVQFGAAGSETEARDMMMKVAKQYSGQLGGGKLGYHHAKVGDKTVFRVRAAGMSKETAVSVCEKVKAAGGNCFVASN